MFFVSVSYSKTSDLKALPSWEEGESKQAIISFVNTVTYKPSPDYVNPEDRIAVFDNDGTLWAEQPLYSQLLFAIERIYVLAAQNPQWKTAQPFAKILSGDVKGALSHSEASVTDIVMAANTGMSDQVYTAIVQEWISRAKHPVTQMLFSQMAYQPMIELIGYLHQHDFKVFIVSGGGSQFIRAFSEKVYGIPVERVIGSTMKRTYENIDGKNVITRQPEMEFYNNNENKVIAINSYIGKRPIAAFGNSYGDLPMLEYIKSGSGETLSMIIHHTDDKREWAYDKKSKIGHLNKGLDQATEKGWHVVDMKTDWKTVF